MGAGSQDFGPSLTAFPGHKQGTGWEVEQPGCEPAPVWDTRKDLATKLSCQAPNILLLIRAVFSLPVSLSDLASLSVSLNFS